MKPPEWVRWTGFALLGIAAAAAVSIAAGNLVSQQIGLASEPVSAGDQLIPKAASGAIPGQAAQPRRHRGRHRHHSGTHAAPPAPVAPANSSPRSSPATPPVSSTPAPAPAPAAGQPAPPASSGDDSASHAGGGSEHSGGDD